MLLRERFEITRPLEEMESVLVRAAERDRELLSLPEEATLRTALCLARMYKVRDGERDVGVGAFLAPFREDLTKRLRPALLDRQTPIREELVPLARLLREPTLRTRDALLRRFRDRLPPEAIDRELRHKALVLVCGGGGGTGYVYMGVMSLLDEFGLRPSLLAGTSIGAILNLFRARMPRFDQTEMIRIVRGLTWRRIFRVLSMESRFGLPAALRLFLRAGVGRYFDARPDGGGGIRLADLPIPTLITVAGVRAGRLPHPVDFYSRVLRVDSPAGLSRGGVLAQAQRAMSTLAEFFTQPEILVKLHLGADATTAGFDAIDAAGFSSALPGIIHYDMLRDDPRMRELLETLFEQHRLSALVDGGLVDNLPARAAWRAVHKGRIGTRNAFILALNGFAPRITTPLWLPLQRLAAINVEGNRPYAHQVIDFRRTLSPLDLVPDVELTARAFQLGRAQLSSELPFLTRLLAPLPAL